MRPELKLVPPDPKRSPNWYIRGTYLGVGPICRSAKTGDRATAKRLLEKIKREIEQGIFASDAGPTFASAAVAYMNAGGERQFMEPIIREIGRLPLAKIDQDEIDRAAMAIAGERTPATRNRTVYTPVSAVLRQAGVSMPIRRPRGAQGRQRKHWLTARQADAFLAAAWQRHPRFAALCTTLLYCGCRLSEALRLQVHDLHFGIWTTDGEEGFADVADTKNGAPQRLHLPPVVVQAMRAALDEPANPTWIPTNPKKPKPGTRTNGSVFCLTKSGALYALLAEVEELSGVTIPEGVSFHIFRHTFGAWTRAAGGRLEETQRWTSRGGAKPYDHYEVTEAAKVANRFPGATKTRASSVKKRFA